MKKIARALTSIYQLTGIAIIGDIAQQMTKTVDQKESFDREVQNKKNQFERAKKDVSEVNPFKKSS